jgi:hypothetical protein
VSLSFLTFTMIAMGKRCGVLAARRGAPQPPLAEMETLGKGAGLEGLVEAHRDTPLTCLRCSVFPPRTIAMGLCLRRVDPPVRCRGRLAAAGLLTERPTRGK